MNPLKIPATLLEDKGIQKFKKNGDEIEFRNILVRVGAQVIKFKTATDIDTENLIDRDVELIVELRTDNSLGAQLRVVEVSPA